MHSSEACASLTYRLKGWCHPHPSTRIHCATNYLQDGRCRATACQRRERAARRRRRQPGRWRRILIATTPAAPVQRREVVLHGPPRRLLLLLLLLLLLRRWCVRVRPRSVVRIAVAVSPHSVPAISVPPVLRRMPSAAVVRRVVCRVMRVRAVCSPVPRRSWAMAAVLLCVLLLNHKPTLRQTIAQPQSRTPCSPTLCHPTVFPQLLRPSSNHVAHSR